MSERIEKALAYHKSGYNCAQAVVCAYCDMMGTDREEAFKISEAFGLGMGTMGTCGAVSAMAMIAGLKNSDGNLEKPATKKETYKLIKQMTLEFQEKNKSVICAELKGVAGGQVLRSCDGCISDACQIIEDVLL